MRDMIKGIGADRLRQWLPLATLVILIADTLEETIGLSHTVLAMRDGAITARMGAAPGRKPAQVDLIGHMV